LDGRVVHTPQDPSAASPHAPRYCPTGQAAVLHALHKSLLRKKPVSHFQAQVSVSYGLPGAMKDELVGFLVHATQGPSAVAVHGPRYWPMGQAVVVHAAQREPEV
jgi:hypothetical protein